MSWKAGKTRPASGLRSAARATATASAIGRSPPRRQGSGNTPTSTRRSSRSWQGSSTGSRRFSCAATNTQDRRDTRNDALSGWYNRRSFSIACEREYDEPVLFKRFAGRSQSRLRIFDPVLRVFRQILPHGGLKRLRGRGRKGDAYEKRRNIAFAVLILAVLAALVLSLSACAEKQTKNALEPYSTGWDGRVYTVTPIDNDKGTISDGTNTYSYRYDASGSGYSVTFTYPDGETYTWTENSSSGRGEASLNFDFEKYPSGMVLKGLLRKVRTTQEDTSAKNWGDHPVSAVRRQYQHCLSAADVASRCRLEGQGRRAL